MPLGRPSVSFRFPSSEVISPSARPPFTNACAVKIVLVAYSRLGADSSKDDRRKVCRSIVDIQTAKRDRESSPNDISRKLQFNAITDFLRSLEHKFQKGSNIALSEARSPPSCRFVLQQTPSLESVFFRSGYAQRLLIGKTKKTKW